MSENQINKPKKPKFRVKLDPHLLDPEVLRDDVALETAVATLEGHFLNAAADQEFLLNDLSEDPSLLGFALSSVDDATASIMTDHILNTFPVTAEEFGGSLACTLLATLSHYYGALEYPSSNLAECQRAADLARPLLKAASMLTFASDLTNDDLAEDKRGNGRSKRPTQRELKKTKRADRAPAIDSKPFANLGVEVPRSREEKDTLVKKVLEDQKGVLKYYLEVVRKAALKSVFKSAYIKEETVVSETREVAVSTSAAQAVEQSAESPQSPAAYPAVQPLKAALYFDSATGFGAWRIWMSQRACKGLRETMKKDHKTFNIIIKKIKELSHGHFSFDNQKRLAGNDADVPIFEAKMTRDTRLIYQVDCLREIDTDVDRQVLRIFGIYTHAQIDNRLWDAVGRQRGSTGKEYRRRCIYRNPDAHSDNVILPASFPPDTPHEETTEFPDFGETVKEELHNLLSLEKFVVFSQALMDGILADEDVSHVFDMSAEEQAIVKHTGSSLVIGRSGTGKTTTMLFKMLGIEQTWDDMAEYLNELMPRPRQLFVTQSRVLAEKVREYFYKLYNSRTAAKRPNLGLSGFNARHVGQEVFYCDEEDFSQDDLPTRFTELEDKHFPLFLTFDRLCRLLEADVIVSTGHDAYTRLEANVAGKNDHISSNDYMRQRRTHFVSFDVFLESYWKHFPQHIVKSLDPVLVYAEFMGVIKGSGQSFEKGYLTRDAYEGLSFRTQPMFANQRSVVYDLFETYTKLKSSRRDRDAADRTHAILHHLRTNNVLNKGVHFIYVDEAQDNSMIDALVLRSICSNPDGLFWAGDTAQTISAGSSFRFDDLKALLHEFERSLIVKQRATTPPKSFQLTRNYRSHAGIMNCAHTVVQLITRFWPYSIDALTKEQGIVDGSKPLFVAGWDRNPLRYEQFLFGDSDRQVEFGAHQCILVRDDAALEDFQSRIGKEIGIILTLYDSKGLEFDDVLLYNFFEDSSCTTSQWRVLLNALAPDVFGGKSPTFDESLHNGLCRELKSLYVALTRARKHLWIADCSKKANIMRIIWESHNQIDNYVPGSDTPTLATSSSAEDWYKQATRLFLNKNYMQAMYAYERAHDLRKRNIAEAYFLRAQARKYAAKCAPIADQAKFYKDAAKAFWRSAEEACDSLKESLLYFQKSADCFLRAEDHEMAAVAFEKAEVYTLSASHYRLAGKFDDAVRVVQDHSQLVESETIQSIKTVAKLYYLNAGSWTKAVALCQSDEDALEFMDDYGFTADRAALLEERKLFSQAAEVHAQEHDFSQAVRLELLEDSGQERDRRACGHLLAGFWRTISLGISVPSPDPRCHELFNFCDKLCLAALDDYNKDQLQMFQAIWTHDTERLTELGHRFYSHHGDLAAFILCFDNLFSKFIEDRTFGSMPALVLASTLEDFLLYAQTLQTLAISRDIYSNRHLQKLLTFDDSGISSESCFIHVGSPLYAQAKLGRHMNASDRGLEITRHLLQPLCQDFLDILLRNSVRAINVACKALPVEPCVRFVIRGWCDTETCRKSHANTDNVQAYNMRVKIHLLKVQIYHTIWGLEPHGRRRPLHSIYLSQLYDALNPFHYRLGSPANLLQSDISTKSRRIVLQWICESFFALAIDSTISTPHQYFFTIIFQLFYLYQWADGTATIPDHYLRRVPWVASPQGPEWLMRAENRVYVVPDVLDFVAMHKQAAISKSILFLRYIVEKQVPIDISVLCDLLDKVCTWCIGAAYLQHNYSLHGITLPRSRFHIVPKDIGTLLYQKLDLLVQFIQAVAVLLQRVSSGSEAGHILYQSHNLASPKMPTTVRNMFLVRMCQTLALFGFNILDKGIKDVCLKSFQAIPKPDQMTGALYERYITACSWQDLTILVSECISWTSLDDLVTIVEEGRPCNLSTAIARHVEISTLLPAVYTRSCIRAPGTKCDEKIMRVESDDPKGVLRHGSSLSVESDGGMNESLIVPTSTHRPSEMNNMTSSISEDELSAANTIWTGYRRYRDRRRSKSLTSLHVQVFLACRIASQQYNWSNSHYRLLYLGPFPHLFACVQGLHTYASKRRSLAKKELHGAGHLELEHAQLVVNETNNLVNRVDSLLQELHPSASLHADRDRRRLITLAKEVQQLIAGIPQAVALQWKGDLDLAIKGIATQAILSKKKPVLNIDDASSLGDLCQPASRREQKSTRLICGTCTFPPQAKIAPPFLSPTTICGDFPTLPVSRADCGRVIYPRTKQ